MAPMQSRFWFIAVLLSLLSLPSVAQGGHRDGEKALITTATLQVGENCLTFVAPDDPSVATVESSRNVTVSLSLLATANRCALPETLDPESLPLPDAVLEKLEFELYWKARDKNNPSSLSSRKAERSILKGTLGVRSIRLDATMREIKDSALVVTIRSTSDGRAVSLEFPANSIKRISRRMAEP